MRGRILILAAFFLLGALDLTGQESEWIANMAEEISEQGGEDLANAFIEHFEYLSTSPLKINYADRNDFEKLIVLTNFQIESLIEYRKSSGNILSAAELSLVNGFDETLVCMLLPYLDFTTHLSGESSVFGGGEYKKFRHNLLFKSHIEKAADNEIGEPVYMQLRYKCIYKNRYQLGILLENDAGEKIIGSSGIPFGDFISLHVAAKDINFKGWKIKNLVIGDYSARFGQGLVMWNSFNMQGNSSVGGLFKRAEAISPYTSSTEYGYLRGFAATISKPIGRRVDCIDLSLFWSYNGVDATVKSGKYTSLSANGLHNTESLLKRKMAIREMVWGASLRMQSHRVSFGINWVSYGFDTYNGVKILDYNRFQQYYGVHGNISADFYWLVKNYRVFGEVAMDYGGNIALLAGFIGRNGEWDLGGIARYYSKGYIAPHSGGYSSSGGCYNQTGISLSAARYLRGGVQLSMGVDGTYYPWYRYNIPSDTYQVKGWAKLEFASDNSSWGVKLYNNFTSSRSVNKVGVKGNYGTNLFCKWLQVKGRGELAYCTSLSGYLAADVVAKACREKLRFYFRVAYYNCKDWLGRLYIYENDLPMSFSSKLMYGEGFNGYIMAQYKNSKFGTLYLKINSDLLFKVGLKSDF